MTSREFQQVLSIAIGVVTLVLIARKLRSGVTTWRLWVPFIIITTFTILFYVAVLLGLNSVSFGDWSATLRLTTQIALMFYAYYMPPGSKTT